MSTTKNLRDGVLTIYDSGRTNSLIVVLDEGDLTYTEVKNVIEVMDRGKLDHLREGDEEAMDLSFSTKFTGFHFPTTATTPYEALTGRGGASAWSSTRAEDVYCVSLEFQLLDTSDSVEETVVFDDFYTTDIEFAEGDEYNTLSVSGRSFSTSPTIS